MQSFDHMMPARNQFKVQEFSGQKRRMSLGEWDKDNARVPRGRYIICQHRSKLTVMNSSGQSSDQLTEIYSRCTKAHILKPSFSLLTNIDVFCITQICKTKQNKIIKLAPFPIIINTKILILHYSLQKCNRKKPYQNCRCFPKTEFEVKVQNVSFS